VAEDSPDLPPWLPNHYSEQTAARPIEYLMLQLYINGHRRARGEIERIYRSFVSHPEDFYHVTSGWHRIRVERPHGVRFDDDGLGGGGPETNERLIQAALRYPISHGSMDAGHRGASRVSMPGDVC